jgi:hypothetical protein
MKDLIDRISRSAKRLQAFWKLSREEELAVEALRKEIRIHLRYSVRLYLKSLFRKR